MARKTPVTRQQKIAAAIDLFDEAGRLLQEIDLRNGRTPVALRDPIRTARNAAKAGSQNLTTAIKLDAPTLPWPRSA